MKTTLFCFSGSGNSYWVAAELAKALGNTRVVMIPSLLEGPDDELALSERVGIIYPVYKGFPPNLATHFVEEILAKAAIAEIEYCFQIATYSLTASWAMYAMEQTLFSIGITTSYSAKVRMVNTYAPLFATPSDVKIDARYAKATAALERIKEEIADEAIKLRPRAPLARLATKVLMHPIQRAAMDDAEQFIVTDACDGCGVCYRICPSHNIELVDERPKWDRVCSGCLGCYHRCPTGAITFRRSPRGGQYPNPQAEYTMEYR